jgi:hypothetical protein
VLPQQVVNSVVRYRIEYTMQGQTQGGVTYLSPRPTEAVPYHAYFVDPNFNVCVRVCARV